MDRNFGDLPESVDVVIVGTDVTQSILAAACARNGLSVLHIDRNDYYGDKSCVFSFNALKDFFSEPMVAACEISNSRDLSIDDTEELIPLNFKDDENFNLLMEEYLCHSKSTNDNQSTDQPTAVKSEQISNDLPEEPIGESSSASNSWTREKLVAASRRFNIDMSPNLVFSTGKTVELLVSSDVARYVEFKSVGKLFVHDGKTFEHVPCSRSDIFSENRLSLIEKRLLMRLFATAMDLETKMREENIAADRLFVDYLRQTCRLNDKLVFFVINAITMASEKCSTLEGLNRCRNFLKSCNVYGPTPFLWPLYGSAEFSQAFCRLAAVYGAVYVLRSAPSALIRRKEDSKISAVVLENGKRVSCKFLVSSSSYCSSDLLANLLHKDQTNLRYNLTFRAIVLSDKSLYPFDPAQPHASIILARMPREHFTVTIIELPDHAQVCPTGTFLHQVTASISCLEDSIPIIEQHAAERAEFSQTLKSLFSFDVAAETEKPKVLWYLQFAKPYLTITNNMDEPSAEFFKLSDNIFVIPDALSDKFSFDYDLSINIAELIFKQIKPDADEFIPRMPQPPVSEDLSAEVVELPPSADDEPQTQPPKEEEKASPETALKDNE